LINHNAGHSIQQLDLIGYHHQSPSYMNQVPSDPFAAAAFENAMMYVPEVTENGVNANSSGERRQITMNTQQQ
jgi:hypothetical protein